MRVINLIERAACDSSDDLWIIAVHVKNSLTCDHVICHLHWIQRQELNHL